jgi:hypothetical protein
LLLPDSLKEAESVRIRLDWRGSPMPAGRSPLPSATTRRGRRSRGQSRRSPTPSSWPATSSSSRGRSRPIPAAGRPATRLLFAFARSGFGFQGAELADLATRIITAERDFFADWSDPLFVVTLVPDERDDRHSIGGTGLTNSFASSSRAA